MTGVVGVIANDSARYSLFASCIDRLDMPDGWKKQWVIGGDWCDARNQLCQMVLDSVLGDDGKTYDNANEVPHKVKVVGPRYSHLWFMDDDHAFPPEILTKLLAHDVPLVTPVCLTRVYPFNPVQYVAGKDGGKTLPIPLSRVATDGLIEVEAAGCAGMLIRRDVIEATREIEVETCYESVVQEVPWFEYTDKSEDVLFCEKARKAGFTLYTDLSVRLGHITTAVVWPAVEDGRWVTGLNVGRDLKVTVDTFEGFLEKEQSVIWRWKLTPETQPHKAIVMVDRPVGEPVNWQPSPSDLPQGVLQWWLDEQDGNGFHPVGDPFTYTLEEAK